MSNIRIGYAMCGSYCTFEKSIKEIEKLVKNGFRVIPIMSKNAYTTDTRFGKAADIVERIENITDSKVVHSIKTAEPIGPKDMCDIIAISPCTGNTIAKIANGITDTAVTMATKSLLRVGKPIVIALATNDALGISAQNIGKLFNFKNIYFVPISQDDHKNKPNSLVANFDLLQESIELALSGTQIQPIFQ